MNQVHREDARILIRLITASPIPLVAIPNHGNIVQMELTTPPMKKN